MIALALLTGLVSAGPAPDAEEDAARFAAPIEICETAGAKIASLLYPTPVLDDIDGDGEVEMILGDLPGNLWVCERVENGGPMDWSEPVQLESGGEKIKFDNW